MPWWAVSDPSLVGRAKTYASRPQGRCGIRDARTATVACSQIIAIWYSWYAWEGFHPVLAKDEEETKNAGSLIYVPMIPIVSGVRAPRARVGSGPADCTGVN